MAVLPAASKKLLPKPLQVKIYILLTIHVISSKKVYHYNSLLGIKSLCFIKQNLMLSESSPVIDYYPGEFTTDLNGKLQEWEAVVLIPFIDEVCSRAVYTLENSFILCFQ